VLARPGGVALHEILYQHQDVVLPFSDGWHFDGKHVEAIKEILAEGSIGYGCLQITIRSSDDANVDLDGLGASDPLEFSFLEDS
jgi:hypothetical protein